MRTIFLLLLLSSSVMAADFYVAPNGDDKNPGTVDRPLATITQAQILARQSTAPRTIFLRGGIYYLDSAIVFSAEDSGTSVQAFQNEQPIVSGGIRLPLDWQPYREGIFKAQVPKDFSTDQLFVNGSQQILARYPNYDPKVDVFNGYAADAISPQRAAKWADPPGGFFHALHSGRWGSLEYVITGKDANNNITYEGGWQNNRPSQPHKEFRFVENIFEELDSPGEWFLDNKTGTLYFYPPKDLDLPHAMTEAAHLKNLIEFHDCHDVSLQGITFRHSLRTFMETREPLLRSDWRIYRGGAVLLDGTADCSILDCTFDHLGGNAIFVSNKNRNVTIRGCEISDVGASAICFVGDPKAVRSPAFGYADRKSLDGLDMTPGPIGDNFPADCLVDDCLIHDIGRVEKQTAGVEISMSQGITVRHCSIYDVPRAGINIGDGCWGGDVIEFCDVFDTVKETSDHGSFNSWCRDRFWLPKRDDVATFVKQHPEMPLLDVVKPITIRNSRWKCDHGWDIDLDDGSTNYRIYDNVCLSGGIKFREGFSRTCANNVIINNSFYSHVWFENSGDVVTKNIFAQPYKTVRTASQWGKQCDDNFLIDMSASSPRAATELQKISLVDVNSLAGDPMFIDAANGDYRVKENSPAIKLGFANFPMDQFGVMKPALRAKARTPAKPQAAKSATQESSIVAWHDLKLKNIADMNEVSAAGLADQKGVLIVDSSDPNLHRGDVILKIDGQMITNVDAFAQKINASKGKLSVWRDQQSVSVTIKIPQSP